MNSLSYNLDLKTVYKESNSPDGVHFDSATKVMGLDFVEEFFLNNSDLFSNGFFNPLNLIVDNSSLKGSQVNGPCLLLDSVVGNELTTPYVNINSTGSTAYVFKRYAGKISIYKTFLVTVSGSNWAATTSPLFITNIQGSTKAFSLSDLVNLKTGTATYLTANSITWPYFSGNYCEFIPLTDVQSNVLNLSYFPIYKDFVVYQSNTNGTYTVITPTHIDQFNGLLTITPASNVTGYYILYAAIPLFYPVPTSNFFDGRNNGESFTTLYLSN